jgi:hypothetical protein
MVRAAQNRSLDDDELELEDGQPPEPEPEPEPEPSSFDDLEALLSVSGVPDVPAPAWDESESSAVALRASGAAAQLAETRKEWEGSGKARKTVQLDAGETRSFNEVAAERVSSAAAQLAATREAWQHRSGEGEGAREATAQTTEADVQPAWVVERQRKVAQAEANANADADAEAEPALPGTTPAPSSTGALTAPSGSSWAARRPREEGSQSGGSDSDSNSGTSEVECELDIVTAARSGGTATQQLGLNKVPSELAAAYAQAEAEAAGLPSGVAVTPSKLAGVAPVAESSPVAATLITPQVCPRPLSIPAPGQCDGPNLFGL